MSAVGQTIGPYSLVRLLGKGGMSEVYEATNPRLGTRHAVKVFAYEKGDEEVRARFEAEGRLLARLNHPRVVRVSDFGVDSESGRPYFVMDMVTDRDGVVRSLAEVAPGTADEEAIGAWYDDLREGLGYIHAQGVVHRDLKLQNVLIGPDGRAVLTDFGISRVCPGRAGEALAADTVRTLVKVRDGRQLVMGSLGYMAPELEMGVAATPQSDWYALGVLVYHLLTGTWCDARTDLAGTLDTFDPVWRRILPKLLHSNPAGRECLAYAEEKRAERERDEAEAEERWLREKQRGHLARHVARYVAVVAVVAGLAIAFVYRNGAVRRARLGERLVDATELVDSAVEKIDFDRRNAEFDSFGHNEGFGRQSQPKNKKAGEDEFADFGDFGEGTHQASSLEAVRVLLVRASQKLHALKESIDRSGE